MDELDDVVKWVASQSPIPALQALIKEAEREQNISQSHPQSNPHLNSPSPLQSIPHSLPFTPHPCHLVPRRVSPSLTPLQTLHRKKSQKQSPLSNFSKTRSKNSMKTRSRNSVSSLAQGKNSLSRLSQRLPSTTPPDGSQTV